MLKRILAIALGVLVGSLLAMGVAQLTAGWRIWPDRELNRSAAYIRDVLELVNREYVEQGEVEIPALTHAALQGLVSGLDPHSKFLPARDYSTLQEEINNEFGGIGVQVEMQNERVVVVAPIAGTPGERAGILRGDQIVGVDGESVVGSAMDAVIGKLRGKPGSRVEVELFRPDVRETYTVRIRRELIKVESVREVRVLRGNVGYIQLTQFGERTGEEFVAAWERLQQDGVQGLVLDLRNNPGGLLDAAVEVAEPFFDRGDLIVYTQGRQPGDREEFRAEAASQSVRVPVAVLINAGSASAAEIVAGALKDTRRAVVVGERSFGKGSVQTIFRLNNGEGLRLTTARYYTPSGVTIHERGVEPDVELVMAPEEDRKLRLQRARDDITDPAQFEERFGFAPIEDRQLEAALDVLRAARLLDERDPAGATTAAR